MRVIQDADTTKFKKYEITDPALNAAVTSTIVSTYSLVIITTTGASNAQTLQAPNVTTNNTRFTVANNDTSTNAITVNGTSLEAGVSKYFIRDGTSWITEGAGSSGDTLPITDTTAVVKGSADATKLVRIEADGLTTGTTRVATMPDKDGTLAMTSDITGTNSGTNTGDQTLPVKNTGAEIDTGTDDAKFATAKAIKDSKNVPSVAPGADGNVLTSNGTDWVSETPSGGDGLEVDVVVLASKSLTNASTTTTYSHGLGAIPTLITATAFRGGDTESSSISEGTWENDGSNTNNCVFQRLSIAGGASSVSGAIVIHDGSNKGQSGKIQNVTSTNFDIVWTYTATPTFTTFSTIFKLMK